MTFCTYQKSIIRTENFYMSIIYDLKTNIILLQFTLHEFQYFLTTCLFTKEIYQQMSQLNSFNRNYLMVLFNCGWSPLINKLSLIRSLNLFASKPKISKWSKSIKQLFRWSDTAGSLTLWKRFPVKLKISICSAIVVVCVTIVRNLAVSTLVSLNNVMAELTKRVLSWGDFFPTSWRI